MRAKNELGMPVERSKVATRQMRNPSTGPATSPISIPNNSPLRTMGSGGADVQCSVTLLTTMHTERRRAGQILGNAGKEDSRGENNVQS